MPLKQVKLSTAGLLEGLPPIIRALAEQGTIRQYRANAMLITEGDYGGTVFVILDGMLRVYCSDASGREITLALYGRGEYVGEMSLDGGPRSANVSAECATVCACISGSALRQHVATHPDFALELIQRLIGRARLATENARSLALLDAYGRLARLLNALSVQHDGSQGIVEERLTHLAIAKRIGCSRELVSRILRDLENGGFISFENRQVVIHKRLPPKW